MPIALVLLTLSLVVCFLLRSKIQAGAKETIQQYRTLFEEAAAEHKRLAGENKELKRELTSLKNAQAMAAAEIAAAESRLPEDPDKSKVEDFLIGKGILSMEQHQKVLKGIASLGMDYLNVCRTLGFITEAQADQAKKAVS